MTHVLVNSLINEFWNMQSVLYFVAVLVFLNGRRLIRSVAFFYLGGVLLGLSLSFLLFGYLMQRLIPIPNITKIPLFFGGWPLSLYIYYLLWTNFDLLFREYKLHAILYLCFFVFVSLGVCYRVGPPSDNRTLNLIVWLLQLCSLSTIYFFSLNRFRGIASVAFLLIFSFWQKHHAIIFSFAKNTNSKLSNFIYGPQSRKLLTEAEYREEGRLYTQMQLERMRRQIQSQKVCDALGLIYQLHTANRTSSFIAGYSEHISPQEKSKHLELFGFSDDQQLYGNDEMDDDEFITDDD